MAVNPMLQTAINTGLYKTSVNEIIGIYFLKSGRKNKKSPAPNKKGRAFQQL